MLAHVAAGVRSESPTSLSGAGALRELDGEAGLQDAAKYCESMATELFALASHLGGVAQLLTAHDRSQMPLLDILVEQEQKEDISHPSVQRYLQVK